MDRRPVDRDPAADETASRALEASRVAAAANRPPVATEAGLARYDRSRLAPPATDEAVAPDATEAAAPGANDPRRVPDPDKRADAKDPNRRPTLIPR